MTRSIFKIKFQIDVAPCQWTVREFDCALSRDVVELCDREAELLNRGRGAEALVGLRKRLSNLFLTFIETPDFNPESVRFLKAPPSQPHFQHAGQSDLALTKQKLSITA